MDQHFFVSTCTGGNRIKSFLIIASQRTHHPVPESKIQTVITFEILVMLIVTNGSVYPLAYRMCCKSFRIQFISKMAIYVVDNHQKKENEEVKKMYWYCKKKNR